MNKTIKQYAIQTKICPPEALDDPEGYDGYEFYDKLTKFVELTKSYYVNRELAKTCKNDIESFLRQSTVSRNRRHAEAIVQALVGEQLTKRWWNSPNKAFNMMTPEEAWKDNQEFVYNYLCHHAYSGGGS